MAMNGAILGGLIGAGSGYLLHKLLKAPENSPRDSSGAELFWCVMGGLVGGLVGMYGGDSFCTQTIDTKQPFYLKFADKNFMIISIGKTTISSGMTVINRKYVIHDGVLQK
jgi:hypothetical protein